MTTRAGYLLFTNDKVMQSNCEVFQNKTTNPNWDTDPSVKNKNGG